MSMVATGFGGVMPISVAICDDCLTGVIGIVFFPNAMFLEQWNLYIFRILVRYYKDGTFQKSRVSWHLVLSTTDLVLFGSLNTTVYKDNWVIIFPHNVKSYMIDEAWVTMVFTVWLKSNVTPAFVYTFAYISGTSLKVQLNNHTKHCRELTKDNCNETLL